MANILETVVFADGETANTQQATGTQTAADPNATQQVVTIGGICGKVAKIKDEYVFIETGNIGTPDQKSVVKMERDAIRTVETAKN